MSTTIHKTTPNGIMTIALSPRIFVQGVFIRTLDEARVVVCVGDTEYVGRQINSVA